MCNLDGYNPNRFEDNLYDLLIYINLTYKYEGKIYLLYNNTSEKEFN